MHIGTDTETGQRTAAKKQIFTLEGAKVNYTEQGMVYLIMPDNIPVGVKIPVVIAVHGSGRCALDYRDTDFYVAQRNMALENGYGFATISNGPDTWGLDYGLYNFNLLYDYLMANYPIQEKAISLSGERLRGSIACVCLDTQASGSTAVDLQSGSHAERMGRCVIAWFFRMAITWSVPLMG